MAKNSIRSTFRYARLLWIPVIVVSAFGLYCVKYEVQRVRGQIAQTTKELKEARESLNVAEAEWAYLNRPDRLKQLAEHYLSSQNATVNQVAEIEAVPFPTIRTADSAPPGMMHTAAMIVPDRGEE